MTAPLILRKAALALLCLAIPLPCAAAAPIGAVQAAAAAIVVKGFRTADSAPVEAHGSGFFTSRDGYLVTSYHLVSDLLEKGVDERTLTYRVTPEGRQQTGAAVAWKSDAADLMVLQARIGNVPVKPLKPNLAARSELRLIETPIFTGGYPDGYAFVADRGYIKSFEGPADSAAPAWVTNMSFKAGQSGSPVVMEDGRVAAVVEAVDLDADSLGILVPIRDIPLNYWQDGDAQSPPSLAGFSLGWPAAAVLSAVLLFAAAALFPRSFLSPGKTPAGQASRQLRRRLPANRKHARLPEKDV
jgi:S1-C subfamily serine protease